MFPKSELFDGLVGRDILILFSSKPARSRPRKGWTGRSAHCENTESRDPRIVALADIIQKQRGIDDLSSKALARLVNPSPSRLSHLFHEQMGLTLRAYVPQQRLIYMRQLLQVSFTSVKEAVAAARLGDVSHAVRDYKRLFGTSPNLDKKGAKCTRREGYRLISRGQRPLNS